MPQWEVLNVEQHGALRLARPSIGSRQFIQIVASEFAAAALDHPILFTKHPETGRFYAGVLLALQPGEAQSDLRTSHGYRPADLEREGFYVDGERIIVDRDHARLAGGAGDPLFDDGVSSAALRRVQAALAKLHTGLPATEALIERLLAANLIEPIDISLSFDTGERLVLEDLYTISLDALNGLPDTAALQLFRAGDLQLCYVQAASVAHVGQMARRRNDRLAGPVT